MAVMLLVLLILTAAGPPAGTMQERSAGSSKPTCEASLQDQIDASDGGGTLTVRTDCIFRETITIDQSLVLDGQGDAEIRGSDIWDEWIPVDGGWRSTLTLDEWDSHGTCTDGEERCLWPEQVFVDVAPLIQVASGVMPAHGEFSVTSERHVIIANDPDGSVVEVTTRRHWVRVEADDVVVQGFTMRHAANDSQDGALRIDGGNRWLIQDNRLAHAHGAVVHFSDTGGGSLSRNDLSFGGQQGFSGSGSDVVISDNFVHHNNTEGFSTAWEAGGAKVTRSERLVIEGNEFAWNTGPGIWCDIDCRGILIVDNDVHHNAGIGIFFEISDGAEISNNRVWENSRRSEAGWVMQSGIVIASSRNTDVHDNVVAWNGDGIAVLSQCRARLENEQTCDTSASVNRVGGNQVRHNTIVMDAAQGDDGSVFVLAWVRDIRDENDEPFNFMFTREAANSGRDNLYWYPASLEESGLLFAWGNENISTISAFNDTPGEENGRQITTEERDRILIAAGIPTSPEPVPG